MTEVCFIGDSQIAAMRYAWRELRAEFPDISISFFSSHRRRFKDLLIDGDTLVPMEEDLRATFARSSIGKTVITAGYDKYILCGLDYSMHMVMAKLTKFRSEDQVSDSRAPVSSGCYLRAMTGCLRESVAIQTAHKLRAITKNPLTIIPSPRISETNDRRLYPLLEERGDAARIAGHFFKASDILGAEVGAQVTRQPPETLRDPLRTLAIYSNGAPREFGFSPRPDDWKDYQHMNAKYGELSLRQLFAGWGFS